MICFKDMTFCNAKDCVHFGDKETDPDMCFRSLTDKVKEDAEQWWGNDEYPICIFTEKPKCYTPKSTDKTKCKFCTRETTAEDFGYGKDKVCKSCLDEAIANELRNMGQ